MGEIKRWRITRKNGIVRWVKKKAGNWNKKRREKPIYLGKRKEQSEESSAEAEVVVGEGYRQKKRRVRFQKLKTFFRNRFSQLKWRFGLYIPLCVVLAFAGTLFIGYITNYLQDRCIKRYADENRDLEYYEFWYDMDGVMHYGYTEINGDMETVDAVYNFVTALQFFLIPAWILFSVYLTGKIFYNRELKTPINLLLDASRRIADNQLDFQLKYDKPNEFGMLCRAFDEMRSALYDSNRQLWRSLEERKRLNAAFSHDLRTPLTVLRGYADFLEKYIPGGNVSEQKLLEVLGMMSGHIVRLEHYTQKMNSVQKLGDIVPSIALASAEQIKNGFLHTGELLCDGKRFELAWQGEGVLRLDLELVFQIYENLVSNACRYAAGCVSVKCAVEGGMFLFVVTDDGKGFSPEALRSASEPFFRDEREPDKTHFGLGLYICRILCEKCGGTLKIGNVVDGEGAVCGGKVTAMVAC